MLQAPDAAAPDAANDFPAGGGWSNHHQVPAQMCGGHTYDTESAHCTVSGQKNTKTHKIGEISTGDVLIVGSIIDILEPEPSLDLNS